MTDLNPEPPTSPAVPGPAAPRDAHSIESKFIPPTHSFPKTTCLPVQKLDRFITHLSRLLHTRHGHDSVVLFLAYTTQLVVSVLEAPGPGILQKSVLRLGQLTVGASCPSALPALFAPRSMPLLSAIPAFRIRLTGRLKALLDMLNDWHTMSRLWGFVTMWMLTKEFITSLIDPQAKDREEKGSPQDQKVNKTITGAQILSLMGFFVLENTSWLSMRGILKWSDKSRSRFLVWCVKSWSIYVFAELGRLLYERVREIRSGEKRDAESRAQWNKKFIQASAWAPLSIHWARPEGLLPNSVAAFLAAYAEFITVKGLWEETAEAL